MTRERRRSKQQFRDVRGISARSKMEKTNSEIKDILESVIEKTAEKRQVLLLSDKPHQVENLKVKWTTGIRPARMGKHGVAIPASRINKKKAKKLVMRQISAKQILEAVNANEIDMA